MVINQKLSGCVAAAMLICGAVAAQDAPSWRALQDPPKRPDLPPEVESPKYEFSVAREELLKFDVHADAATVAASPDAIPATQSRSAPAAGLGEPVAVTGTTGDPLPPAPAFTPTGSYRDRETKLESISARPVESADRRPPVALAPTPAPAPVGGTDDEASIAAMAAGYRLVRSRTVQPKYPRKAYRDGLEGWVNLRVTVSPGGKVEGVEVVDSEPRWVFDDSAVYAVRQWRFEPPQRAGLTTDQSGMYRISFTMDGS